MAESLSEKEVAHVAHLARLSVTDTELTQYTQQLSAILGYVDQLQQAPLSTDETVSQVTGLMNVLDADMVGPDQIATDAFLAAAPAAEPPYVKVKAVLE